MHEYSPQPSHWVIQHSAHIKPEGKILDLAAGSGRNARWLAAQGFLVEAVDRDNAALQTMQGLRNINLTHLDMENGEWVYGNSQFDAIVVCRYLHRPLLPWLVHSLVAGGVLIYETFMMGNEAYGSPKNPDFLLNSNELLDTFQPLLTVIAYEEGLLQETPTPAVLQRIAAIKLTS
ncbi:methyltransferase domain-containing protein [Methylobacillus gramineus]|uniref:class I SAM-dependent methyltransferase n=1 Tax=Methylobacillus gramineus TaxID=755169 RepID=UPI001CFFE56C|nr:methyltransferase domain-containing protein [Methylobacillus gramineus]MCB5184303.1 methyltransferase domain-containing protein [Methylobacillus gramineus]